MESSSREGRVEHRSPDETGQYVDPGRMRLARAGWSDTSAATGQIVRGSR